VEEQLWGRAWAPRQRTIKGKKNIAMDSDRIGERRGGKVRGTSPQKKRQKKRGKKKPVQEKYTVGLICEVKKAKGGLRGDQAEEGNDLIGKGRRVA